MAEKKDGPAYFDNCTARSDYAYTAMKLSGAVKYKITEGWFDATIPPFVPPEPIAFLHLDADWYESTITCLDGLFRHVAGGGLIVLDDYHVWDGCSRAVHDFLSKHSAPERIRSLGNLCYIEKK